MCKCSTPLYFARLSILCFLCPAHNNLDAKIYCRDDARKGYLFEAKKNCDIMQKRLLFVKERFPRKLKELSDDVAAYCEAEIEAANVKPSISQATKEFRQLERKAFKNEDKAAAWRKHQEERAKMGEAYTRIKFKVDKKRSEISAKLSRLGTEEFAKGEL